MNLIFHILVPPSAVIAMVVGFVLFLLLILYCICKRGIFKRRRKEKAGKKKVDMKSVQLLGKQLGKDQVSSPSFDCRWQIATCLVLIYLLPTPWKFVEN